MFKKLFIAISVLLLVCALFTQSPITHAVTNSQVVIPTSQETNTTEAPVKRQIVPRVINGELDLESNIIISGVEKQNFDYCKQTEKKSRSVRNKNKPTACFKQPKPINEELTDQDYTTLFDRLQDKKDIDDKKDMNVELKLSNFLDIKNIPVCNETGFNDNVKVLSKLGLDSNTNIPNCSSVTSSSSLISSTSFSFSATSKSSSSMVSSLITASSQTISKVSASSITGSKTSFLDFLFGTVKADAAGTIVYDYRFPYQKDVRIKTYYTFDDVDTHVGHNAVDFYGVDNNNNKLNFQNQPNIVAAKGGKIVESQATYDQYGNFASLGKHIVILQDDGKYAMYGHLSSRLKAVNDIVSRGDIIGIQGDTGTERSFNNSHLHFEVLDPSILNYSGGNINGIYSTCQNGWDSGYCYRVYSLDAYKIYPAYDECFVSRGGTQDNENKCQNSSGTGNAGYPWRSQSSIYWTSVNGSTPVGPTRPPVYNNQPGSIDLRGNPQVWSLDVQNYGELNPNGTYDQTPVIMILRTISPNNAQKWQYFPNTKEIKGMNDMCLEAGFANEGDFARVQTCSNNSNQKWTFNSNKTLSIDYTNRCLQYENQYTNENKFRLVVRNCTAGGNQIWDGNGMNIPAAIVDPNIGTVLPPQANYNWAMDNRCNTANDTQVVMRGRNNGDCQKMRYNSSNQTITNPYAKCLDAGDINSSSNNYLRFSTCNNGNNQKWKQEAQNLGGRIWSLQKNSSNQTMCIEYQSLTDQFGLNVVPCNSNQGQKWYGDVLAPYSESIATPPPTPPTLTLKAFLAGPYNGTNGNMNKGLNPNLLPLSEPYCTTPWNYCGGEAIATRANINASFVDWVLIEIRNTSGATIWQKAGLISQSGYLYDLNGSTLTVPNITSSGTYKVIIRHRNHIAVSMNNINFAPGSNTSLNFTNNVNVTGGNQCSMGNSVYALCFGDVNKDTYIDASDRSLVGNAQDAANQYSQTDLNLDSYIDATDRTLIQNAPDRVTNI